MFADVPVIASDASVPSALGLTDRPAPPSSLELIVSNPRGL
ncbi:hypothetical protein [Aquidulcibacter paucihalophilus]|nr:hypothetical protein [Aquidulcibacter paucihalophilus]